MAQHRHCGQHNTLMERKLAEVPVNINGVICDLYGRTITGPVKIVGSMSRTDVGVGGGPVFPPDGEKPPGGNGDHIWGPTDPRPTPPIAFPPGWVGGVPPLPPNVTPPEVPPPGTVTAIPGNFVVAPIVPPEYMIVQYPGIGPVVVTAPPHAEPAA